jgi:hypothetical protein
MKKQQMGFQYNVKNKYTWVRVMKLSQAGFLFFWEYEGARSVETWEREGGQEKWENGFAFLVLLRLEWEAVRLV